MMSGASRYVLLWALLLLPACSKPAADSGGGEHGAETAGFEVSWDKITKVCTGGYGRMHRLTDGRLMLAYGNDSSVFARFSSDDGAHWGNPVTVMAKFTYYNRERKQSVRVRCTRPDFAQLPDGSILCTITQQPAGNRTWLHAECIVSTISKDGGRTWSPEIETYPSQIWEYRGVDDVPKGAMESSVLVLPDGRVQVYFTDNTPYYRAYLDGKRASPAGNCVMMVESSDGGYNWSAGHIVCNSDEGSLVGWDCMPVVLCHDAWIYLIIEHKDVRGVASDNAAMNLQMMSCRMEDGWPEEVIGKYSDRRFYPYPPQRDYYCGAPYIIKTEDYFVIVGQSAENSTSPLTGDYSAPQIHCVPLSSAVNGKFSGNYQAPAPIKIDQTVSSANWNSLCPLGDNTFYVVTTYQGAIWINKATIKNKK